MIHEWISEGFLRPNACLFFGIDDDEDDPEADLDLIPGDNDKPSETVNAPNAPDNLTSILPSQGQVPVTPNPST